MALSARTEGRKAGFMLLTSTLLVMHGIIASGGESRIVGRIALNFLETNEDLSHCAGEGDLIHVCLQHHFYIDENRDRGAM